jgi:hypothetical protein
MALIRFSRRMKGIEQRIYEIENGKTNYLI